MTPLVRFLGSKAQGLATLRALVDAGVPLEVVTIDDSDSSRSVLPAIVQLAADAGLPLQVVHTRREASEALQRTPVTLGVVVGWYWLLSAAERRSATLGYVGVHNSLLPSYRGGSPLNWALIDGATTVGSTLFSIGDGIDDGEIWSQIRLPVGPEDGIDDVLERLTPLAVAMVADAVPGILDGSIRGTPQSTTDASWCAQRLPDDGVIDWRWPARRVHDFIRAQREPYPGAFSFLDGARVQIWRASVEPQRWRASPGQVVAIDGRRVLVACGDDTVLSVDEITRGGERGAAGPLIRTRSSRFPAVPLLLDQFAVPGALLEAAC
jgi:methionyl-tRNA formyltransferase